MSEILRSDRAFADIALLTCDVDGVLTDGGLYFDGSGLAMVRFNVLDGLGLKMLRQAGILTAFITQSHNGAIAARAKALGIDYCLMGVEDKLNPVIELTRKHGISLAQVCHIADDINDLTLLEAVGVAVTVPSGVPRVRDVSHFITKAQGGYGAVRELCDTILASREVFPGLST